MKGNALRARRWSIAEGGWKHAPLIEVASTLPESLAIYAISFWKDLASAKLNMGWQTWTEMCVFQRVREDHPFFRNFNRIDDDALPDWAWLFFKSGPLDTEDRWSKESIARSDIEVLDIDGQWRSMPHSHFMRDTSMRFNRQGYRPFYFASDSGKPHAAFWKSSFLTLEGDKTCVAIMVQHCSESELRFHTSPYILQAFLDPLFQQLGPLPVGCVRIFMLEPNNKTFHPGRIWEIAIRERIVEVNAPSSNKMRRWPWHRAESQSQVRTIAEAMNEWRMYEFNSEFGRSVLLHAGLVTLEESLKCYSETLSLL
ncbi:hypothetical protein [Robbsia andropogonis]|uniref:hypothetical protein n=1 Tax=Robbsia andropogonis TaxID=28092 RepID=UPI002A6AEB87|nr:hypothetical protein [Robbsia andropogonis]